MGPMASPIPLKVKIEPEIVPGVSPVCGECGVLIVNVEKHTAWHAGSQQADAAAAVVEFLQSVDPQALEQATLLQPDRPAFEVALELLIEQAAQS